MICSFPRSFVWLFFIDVQRQSTVNFFEYCIWFLVEMYICLFRKERYHPSVKRKAIGLVNPPLQSYVCWYNLTEKKHRRRRGEKTKIDEYDSENWSNLRVCVCICLSEMPQHDWKEEKKLHFIYGKSLRPLWKNKSNS